VSGAVVQVPARADSYVMVLSKFEPPAMEWTCPLTCPGSTILLVSQILTEQNLNLRVKPSSHEDRLGKDEIRLRRSEEREELDQAEHDEQGVKEGSCPVVERRSGRPAPS
jgi:hypothetical protein